MRGLTTRVDLRFALATAICIQATLAARCQGSEKDTVKNKIEHCRRIKNEVMRTRCYEETKAKPAPPKQQPTLSGTWQLARTPNPAGGLDSISITKITNPTPSEHDVTGIMLRCAEGATTNVLVVVATPLPPRSHPKVTIVAGATTTELIASVVPSGTLVLLPEKASALLENAWQAIPELIVSITESQRSLRPR